MLQGCKRRFRTAVAALVPAMALIGAAQNYLEISPRDPGALPTDRARLATTWGLEGPGRDPFDAYVPSLESRYRLGLSPVVHLPHLYVPYLRRGQATTDRANLAIPDWLYVDLRLTADFIFTDNVYKDNANRRSDLVIQTVLTIDTSLQLTDEFMLRAAGNLVYHRALGEDKIYGFGFQDSFYFADTFYLTGLEGNALFATQARWQRQIGNWDFQIGDRFYIANRLMDDPFVDGKVEQATETANIADAALGRLLPGSLRLGLAGERADYWYNNRFRNYNRAETSGTVWLEGQREAMRFQPYTDYTMRHISYSDRKQDGIEHQANLGARGPVTDQMNLEASVGYSYVDGEQQRNQDEFLWRLKIDHLMNSTTRHDLLAERRTTPSADALRGTSTRLQYKIGHQLQRRTTCWLGINKTIYDDNDRIRSTENWGFLATTRFSPAHRMHCTLEYQYVDWDSNRTGRDYTENRLTLSVAWDI